MTKITGGGRLEYVVAYFMVCVQKRGNHQKYPSDWSILGFRIRNWNVDNQTNNCKQLSPFEEPADPELVKKFL